MTDSRPPVRIANASGFFGDRATAMREMLEGGPVDYLTGDYLAELTMLILAKDKARRPGGGYAATFLHQLGDCLDLVADSGVKVVSNAGGLNPAGLAEDLRRLIAARGLDLTVGYVDGDDLTTDPSEESGATGSPLFPGAVSANAYLGAFGIVECLDAGADIVVTGRVTDASVIVAPAAHHFGWTRDDLDRIAGAMAAGHVIECGTQATGGNYPGSTRGELPASPVLPGFPIAEISADGSSVITKHPGTGGAVTAGTVTAQLLYEVTGARYAGPDATLRLDHLSVEDLGADRVRISGAVGEPPPPTTKVSVNRIGGYRNELHVHLTGLDIPAKADLFTRQMDTVTPRPEQVEYRLERTDHVDADTQAAATARLTCVCWDSSEDAEKTVNAWARGAIGIGLGTYSGAYFDGTPPRGSSYGVYEPAYVPNDVPRHSAHLPDGTTVTIAPPTSTAPVGDPVTDLTGELPVAGGVTDGVSGGVSGGTRRVPLGTLVDARSGDKGGSANIGVWLRPDAAPDAPAVRAAAYAWLLATLTPDRIRDLLPETADLGIAVYPLPRLHAVNIVIRDILGHGVAHGARFDPQAKGLGEWLRSRCLDIPPAFATGPTTTITEELP
ncbi:acyclic terpene utilization AtuA family protein [uncultured Corynebacterium sp.]|uniref:acyclic terpene utilization AtuA family protein n=1 Tax=uncultured Corynebacterium sp. TaxID=159447 RepID=UPI0025FA5BB3|nr:acyclic terpene utilization AtuA family protein [uncultured Corynebacterium sp.]